MKKIISYSVWGNDYRYLGGALQNIELAKHYYPDWVCRFYVCSSTNDKFKNLIKTFDNVEVIDMKDEGDWRGLVWRFLAASDSSADIVISRDTDSRIHKREVEAVKAWLNSDKKFHIMRDHQYHSVPILGGMWGVKGDFIREVARELSLYKNDGQKQFDQYFLRDIIFDKVVHDSKVHDEMHRYVVDSERYPNTTRNPAHFVGQAYNGDGSVFMGEGNFNDFLFETEGFRVKVYDEKDLK